MQRIEPRTIALVKHARSDVYRKTKFLLTVWEMFGYSLAVQGGSMSRGIQFFPFLNHLAEVVFGSINVAKHESLSVRTKLKKELDHATERQVVASRVSFLDRSVKSPLEFDGHGRPDIRLFSILAHINHHYKKAINISCGSQRQKCRALRFLLSHRLD